MNRAGIPNTEVLIDPAVETASGLSKICVAACTNILTIEQALITRTIGCLSDSVMRQIEKYLKTVLEAP
jgi:mRNA-degrading endonuclease toxin of MazEF toxin-antitoxin module